MKNIKKSAEGSELLEDGSNYDETKYKHASNTVDVCICTIDEGKLKVLMIKRKKPPFRDKWAIPGGFLDIDENESLDESALRELTEETGVKNIEVDQLATYGEPDRDPRMRVITVAYFACVSPDAIKHQKIKAADDAKEYTWMELNNLPKLAFDHNLILGDLYKRLQGRIQYSDIAFKLVGKTFTWDTLQGVYETVLDRELLKPNFIRKINSTYDIIEIDSPEKSENTRGRPPKYLQFNGIKESF